MWYIIVGEDVHNHDTWANCSPTHASAKIHSLASKVPLIEDLKMFHSSVMGENNATK